MKRDYLTKSKATVLAGLSGGLDSTAMVYNMLTRTHEHELIHIHHIVMKGWTEKNKHAGEHLAVDNIFEYLKEKCFVFETSFSEVYYDYHAFDMAQYYFMLGSLAATLPRVHSVALGRTLSEPDLEYCPPVFRHIPTESGRKIFYHVLETWPLHREGIDDIKIVFPVDRYTKSELKEIIPDELWELTCSCRMPKIKNKTISKCGSCTKCKG